MDGCVARPDCATGGRTVRTKCEVCAVEFWSKDGHTRCPDHRAELDMFAAVQKRDEAIQRADTSVAKGKGGDVLIGRLTERLIRLDSFTADDVGLLCDEVGVPKDQDTRRRIVSTTINRSKGKLWEHAGYRNSADPRRNARPVAIWRVVQ